jgi:hypothetical protein
MYYGHLGVGFAAKALAPRVSIGILLLAATLLDLAAGVCIVLGWIFPLPGGEMGWSHGLFMAVVWSAAAFFLFLAVLKDWKQSLVMGALVFSHWTLDFISHPMGLGRPLPPDLPLLFEGSPLVGLGLYNHSLAPALAVELSLFAAGLAVYFLKTRPVDRTGTAAVWVLAASLVVYPVVMAIPSVGVVIGCFNALVLLPLGLWVERHRRMAAVGRVNA